MNQGVGSEFIKGGSIGDALRALFTRKGVDNEMSRTDQSFFHGGCGLNSDKLVHERLVNAAAKLAQGGGQHKVGLRGVEAVLRRFLKIVLPRQRGVEELSFTFRLLCYPSL